MSIKRQNMFDLKQEVSNSEKIYVSMFFLMLLAHERVLAEKRLKLDYEDLVPLPVQLVQQWDTILQKVGFPFQSN